MTRTLAEIGGFPSQFIQVQINQGITNHTKMVPRPPPGVPHARASLEPGTSGFLTLRIDHYATRGADLSYLLGGWEGVEVGGS